MKKIIYVLLISCFSLTIISCRSGGSGNSSSDNSSTESDHQSQCTAVKTFQKNIFGKQVKQTNDCGYIAVTNGGYLTKLDKLGGTKWETKITLYQKNIVI